MTNNAEDPERVLLKSNETTDEAVRDRVTGDRQSSTEAVENLQPRGFSGFSSN
jgi:hypothetical protein